MKVLNLKLDDKLVERIEEYKTKNGFSTVTSTIIHLIVVGLGRED